MKSGSTKAWLLCGVTASAILWTGAAMAQERAFDVPSESAVKSIPEFGRQAGIQVVAPAQQLRGITTPAIKGSLKVQVALHQLLADSGIEIASNDGQTVILRAPSKNVQAAQNEGAASSGASDVETVLVTAEKRVDDIQKVPVPVTVLDANKLSDNGQVLLRDYYATVPGFSVSPNFTGNQMLSIRGITTGGFVTTTVGVLIDDVPFGLELGNEVPDIDPGDLDHIEVLRGPQGTLYGSDSMGGLIKYVTKDPSTDEFSGRVEAGTDYVKNGAEPGYSLRGSVNIPITDTLAMRASAFNRQEAGYIDNPGNCDGVACAPVKGLNQDEAYGGSVSVLWQPIEDLSLKLNAIYQHTKSDGSSDVDIQPGLQGLQQNYIPGIGGYDKTVQVYSAVLNAKFGPVNVSSITGFNLNRYSGTLDDSVNFGAIAQPAFATSSVAYREGSTTKRVTEELRFSGTVLENLDWLVGGFYSHTDDASHDEVFNAYDPVTGKIVLGAAANPLGVVLDIPQPEILEQYAAFADLTYHITDKFDIQFGGRENHDGITELSHFEGGSFIGASPAFVAAASSHDNAFTYLVTPRYQISPDLMVYARFASGFRPGGPNGTGVGLPPQYGPDQTYNYEIGTKGDFFDHVISVDGSLYYIDWKDIQIQQQLNGFTYTGNGSGAKSEGAELSITARPSAGLTLAAWVSYDDAALTAPLVTSYGVAGSRLPNTPEWSSNASIEQDFPLWASVTGFVGGQLSYVGDRLSVFQPTAVRQEFPSYTKTDLRAGFNFEDWKVSVYVNNVGDVRGQLNGGLGFTPPDAIIYIQPRTVGLSLAKTF